jgi:hypothetical protein
MIDGQLEWNAKAIFLVQSRNMAAEQLFNSVKQSRPEAASLHPKSRRGYCLFAFIEFGNGRHSSENPINLQPVYISPVL